jgi:Holliday junction resolvase RusA-like endonuclease
LKVEAVMTRPAGHYNQSGLSAAGRRSPWPTKVPDVDNLVKLAQDALNRLAFHDDSLIVSVTAFKRWASVGEAPCLKITMRTLSAGCLEMAA